jgi:hypothetical protein
MDEKSREAQENALRALVESEQRYGRKDEKDTDSSSSDSKLKLDSERADLPSDRVRESEYRTLGDDRLPKLPCCTELEWLYTPEE